MLSGDNKIRFSLEICLEKGKQCEIRGKNPQKTEEIEKKILRFSWDFGIVHRRGDRVCLEAAKSYTLD